MLEMLIDLLAEIKTCRVMLKITFLCIIYYSKIIEYILSKDFWLPFNYKCV